jgi:hypothetical protein
MTDYPTLEELQKSIAWSIEQGGNDNYILNDNSYPYTWGYYLHIVEEQKGAVAVAQTHGQLAAFLAGEPQPTADELPKYNIDWDIRSSISDNYLQLKKKDGTVVTMMGTLDFDTPEQGAERWLEQIKERVAKWLWTTKGEQQAQDKEIAKEFQDYYDAHCAGDCEWKESCEVRWPGGHGLRGCRRENPDDDEMWRR